MSGKNFEGYVKGVNEINQKIKKVIIRTWDETSQQRYEVGKFVTKIEIVPKYGEYALIPYVRVWSGDNCFAEIPQSKTEEIIFFTEESTGL